MHARTIFLVSFLAATVPAYADQVSAHANAGLEILGGRDAFSTGLRLHGGIGRSFGNGSVQPTISAGGTLGYANLSVSDPRALDGSVDLGLLEYGPEVTVALRFADGGFADSRVFVSGAWTFVDVDDRLMLDAIDGVEGGQGKRLGIGANWCDRILRYESRDKHAEVLMFFLPHQLELTYERSAGSDRYGATLSWGI
ncbi:MAG: hypothetical protein SFX73_09970 [Kofleriaceae bacterium]|nr:hypothetical protein [Kofleriaceae bacterium]